MTMQFRISRCVPIPAPVLTAADIRRFKLIELRCAVRSALATSFAARDHREKAEARVAKALRGVADVEAIAFAINGFHSGLDRWELEVRLACDPGAIHVLRAG